VGERGRPAPSTVTRDEAYFNSLILPRFGATPLAAFRQPDMQAWVAELSMRGFKPATVVKVYQLLGRTTTAAVNADMAPRSPCRAVRVPKVEREKMRFLNPAEVARLADVIDSRSPALVLVSAYGGLRIGSWPSTWGRLVRRTPGCSLPTRAGSSGPPRPAAAPAAHGAAATRKARRRSGPGLGDGVRRQGLEPRTVALRGHCSAN
jgi:hypothetical protein